MTAAEGGDSLEKEQVGPGWSDQRLDSLNAREAGFVRRIDAAATTISRQYPGLPVVALFDVEYTIGEPDFDNGTDVVVRDGFQPALDVLQIRLGDDWELGICTTKSQASLATELHSPTFLAGATGKIRNTGFLIGSTSRLEATDPELFFLCYHATPAEIVDFLQEILDPVVAQATLDGRIKPHVWYDSKLVILLRLARDYPDRVFILIDDLLAAGAIKPDRNKPDHPKVVGVCVNEYTDLGSQI